MRYYEFVVEDRDERILKALHVVMSDPSTSAGEKENARRSMKKINRKISQGKGQFVPGLPRASNDTPTDPGRKLDTNDLQDFGSYGNPKPRPGQKYDFVA